MMDHLRRLGATLESMVTRGKVTAANLGPRTLLNLTGLDGEAFDQVELLLPPGYCALPVAGSDILILQANGVRNHKVAIAGDAIADRQADLQPGEVGISRNGQRVILRQSQIEIATTMAVQITAATSVSVASPVVVATGVVYVEGDVIAGFPTKNVSLLNHVHPDAQGGNTGAPV